jgi:hypothetical protein
VVPWGAAEAMAERSDAEGLVRAGGALAPAPGAWDGPFYGDVGVLATDGTRVECHLCAAIRFAQIMNRRTGSPGAPGPLRDGELGR